jgi:hypothetical protein
MRLKHSARNLAVAWLGQAGYMVCNFVALGVFGAVLSQDYMGVQGLFTNLLLILSLSELGIGSAITYSLYKPLAEGDTQKVRSLMRLFARAYTIIGVALAVIGLCLTPFIQHFISGSTSIPLGELRLYFFCFVLNSAVTYFFSYKGALIMADQRKYVVSLIQYAFQISMCVAQIVVLLLTHNYLLFLLCMILSSLGQNIVIAYRANKMYPYLREKTKIEPIDAPTLSTIKKNIFALVLHRVAGIASTPASTVIISANINQAAVASFYLYNTVLLALTRIMDQIFDAILASVGNLAAAESPERQFTVFKTTFFINALVYALTAVPLLCVFNAFVGEIWQGPDSVFPQTITLLIVALYYLKGMRSTALSFTSAYGLYWFTRYKAILETVVLLVLSLLLVVNFQVAGVLVAGIISCVCVSTVYEGYMLFKHGLKRPSRTYFLRFALYTAVTAALALIAYLLCLLVPGHGIVPFLLKALISLAVVSVGFIVPFCRTAEFKEFRGIIKYLIGSLKSRLKPT